jgi:hypothetical protein
MKRYLLKTWGGFYNEEHAVKHGKKSGYYWFETEKEIDAYIEELKNLEIKYDAKMLVYKKETGKFINHKTICKIVFEYLDTQYHIIYDFGYNFSRESAIFIFRDGNNSCDCNRSLIIQRFFPDFAELPCGDIIKMTEFVVHRIERDINQNFEPIED